MAKSKKDSKRPSAEVIVVDGVLDVDEAAEVIPFNYAITAYGADPQVDGLVRRMKGGDIFVPLFSLSEKEAGTKLRFQREFVWNKQQADRFIESLLLGLPVPGIFLVKEESGRHLVLDGHQRLRTLNAFYTNEWDGGPFELEDVQDRFRAKTYDTLDASDRRRLDDSIIHATIVRQDQPSEDLSSIFLIFERLNSGGTSLQPQEIRVALYHGPFGELLTSLNADKNWRSLFGRKSKRLKDVELILRFFALLESSKKYSRPMKGFLSSYMAHRRHLAASEHEEYRRLFVDTTTVIKKALGARAFRPKTSLNAALVDALMVGIARRIKAKGKITSHSEVEAAFEHLLEGQVFRDAISRATADEENVSVRLDKATAAFAKVK